MVEKKTEPGTTKADDGGKPASTVKAKPEVKAIKQTVVVSMTNIGAAIEAGTRAQSVQFIQDALKVNGAYKGDMDGWFGPKTKSAFTQFRNVHEVDERQALELLGFTVND